MQSINKIEEDFKCLVSRTKKIIEQFEIIKKVNKGYSNGLREEISKMKMDINKTTIFNTDDMLILILDAAQRKCEVIGSFIDNDTIVSLRESLRKAENEKILILEILQPFIQKDTELLAEGTENESGAIKDLKMNSIHKKRENFLKENEALLIDCFIRAKNFLNESSVNLENEIRRFYGFCCQLNGSDTNLMSTLTRICAIRENYEIFTFRKTLQDEIKSNATDGKLKPLFKGTVKVKSFFRSWGKWTVAVLKSTIVLSIAQDNNSIYFDLNSNIKAKQFHLSDIYVEAYKKTVVLVREKKYSFIGYFIPTKLEFPSEQDRDSFIKSINIK